MNDTLAILKNNPLARRVTDADIEAQEDIFRKRNEEATAPRKISLQDALISSLVRLAPSLIGAAVNGKEGAYMGLQGGRTGGQILDTLQAQDFKAEQEGKKNLADQAQRDLTRLQNQQDRMDLREIDLEDRKELIRLQETLRGQRPKQVGAVDKLVGSIDKLLANKSEGSKSTEEAESVTNSSSNPKGAAGIVVDIEEGVTSDDVKKIGLKGTKQILDTADKGLSVQGKKKGLIKDDLDIQKRLLENAQAETSQNYLTKPYEIGAFTVAVPKEEGIIGDPKTVEKLTTDYGIAIDAYDKLTDIFNKYSRAELAGANPDAVAEASSVRKQLLDAMTRLRATNTESKGSGSETIRKNVDAETVRLDGLWNQISDFLTSSTLIPGKTNRAELIAQSKTMKDTAFKRLDGLGLRMMRDPKNKIVKHPSKGWFAIVGKDENGKNLYSPLNVGQNDETVLQDYVGRQ